MKPLSFLFFMFFCFTLNAQNPIFYSEVYTPFTNNCASFGSWNFIGGQAVARTQGIDESTLNLLAEIRYKVIRRTEQHPAIHFGGGFNAVFDHFYSVKTQMISVPLNAQIEFEKSTFSAGLAPGFFKRDLSLVGGTSTTLFDLGLGVFWYGREFYIGLGATHLPALFANGEIYQPIAELQAAYKFKVGKGRIMPMLRYVQQGGFTNAQCMLFYESKKQLFSVGAGVNLRSSFIAAAHFQWQNIRFGYAFNYYSGYLSNVLTSGHEIRLGYAIGKKYLSGDSK